MWRRWHKMKAEVIKGLYMEMRRAIDIVAALEVIVALPQDVLVLYAIEKQINE